MAILMFTARKHHLRSLIYKYQARLQELTRNLMDHQQYAASIADGSVSIYDMMNVPSSMFGRTMMYMQISHNTARQQANMQFTQMGGIISAQTAGMNPQYQEQYKAWIYNSLYQQARDRFAKREASILNQQEKLIAQEKSRVETALKMAEAELENTKKAEEEGIKNFAPRYTA